jgi:hypothetical protein
MSVRKRKWTTKKGETKEVWVVSYADQYGKRRQKTFDRKKDASKYEVSVRAPIRNGTYIPPSEGTAIASLVDSIAKKFVCFIDERIEPACYLYRHYHPNGDLLYVGVSLRALDRQQNHLGKADWRKLIHRIVIEPFETREAALEAEEIAIRLEFPKFNTTHNGRRHLGREIARSMKYAPVPTLPAEPSQHIETTTP